MISGAIIAEVATLVGDPARATMVSALLDGRALTASELAAAARITPQTASTHLGKLTKAGLLSADRNGRNRYFRLASPNVAEMIEAIVAVALEKRPRFRPLSPQADAVSAARMCYDHLAGRLGVDLADALIAREYIVLGDKAAAMTTAGAQFFGEFGIAVPARPSTRRQFCRPCLDWTERRPHIAGALGAALTKRLFDLGWMERMKRSHAVIVTPVGRRGFQKTFGIEASAVSAHERR
jgi:DNA-binding transcriptional ArsR family regulator